MLLPLALLIGCSQHVRVNPHLANDTPTRRWADAGDGCAVELPVDPTGGFAGGMPLWQGFDITWTYNHRVNRLGSIIEPAAPAGAVSPDQVPICSSDGTTPAECRQLLTVAAASGTGKDTAAVRTFYSLVAASGVGFAGASGRISLSGAEGDLIEVEDVLEVPLDDTLAAAPQHVAVLQGFDLVALESADKLVHLSIQLGEPQLDGPYALVPVKASARMACSSIECPRRDRVDYALQLAVAVVGGDSEHLRVVEDEAAVRYAWDKQQELPETATQARLEAEARWKERATITALRGFSITLEEEKHMLSFGASVHGGMGDRGVADLRFKQWGPGMPLVAYKEPGEAAWSGDALVLELARGSVAPLVHRAYITWPGFGTSALPDDPKAAEVLPPPHPLNLNLVPEGYDPFTAICPSNLLGGLGYKVRTTSALRGELIVVRRNDGALSDPAACPADMLGEVDLPDPKEARARVAELVAAAAMLDRAAEAALAAAEDLAAQGLTWPDGSVPVHDLGVADLQSGGSWIRTEEGGAPVLQVVDGWVVQGEVETAVDGVLARDADGTLRFDGRLVQRPASDEAELALSFAYGWEGSLAKQGEVLRVEVDDACDGALTAEIALVPSCELGAGRAVIGGGGAEVEVDGCEQVEE